MIEDVKRSFTGSSTERQGALVLYEDRPETVYAPFDGTYAHTPGHLPLLPCACGRAHPGNPFASPLDADAPAAAPLVKEKEAATPEDEKEKEKDCSMHPLVKGIVVLTVGPFVMVAACVVAAGSVVYGTGQLIVGVGDIMMGGPLKKHAKRAWDARKEERRTRKRAKAAKKDKGSR